MKVELTICIPRLGTVGDVVDLDVKDAERKIRNGWAKPVAGGQPAPEGEGRKKASKGKNKKSEPNQDAAPEGEGDA